MEIEPNNEFTYKNTELKQEDIDALGKVNFVESSHLHSSIHASDNNNTLSEEERHLKFLENLQDETGMYWCIHLWTNILLYIYINPMFIFI